MGKLCADCNWIADYLDTIPDFPKKGVDFLSITPLLKETKICKRVTQTLSERYRERAIEVIVGIESRGFIFGAFLAYELGLPFVMMRKPGKLPSELVKLDYALEYGKDSLELESESIVEGTRVLVVDDLLATGGTVQAACELIEELGGEVEEVAVIIELEYLDGRDAVQHPVYSLVAVD